MKKEGIKFTQLKSIKKVADKKPKFLVLFLVFNESFCVCINLFIKFF